MTSLLSSRPLNYGTSGFRSKADEQLQLIVYRAAFYAAIRAKKLGKAVGIMITASHNPACDNGLKLVDPSGKMLAMECEKELTKIANGTEQEFGIFRDEMIQLIKNNEEKDNIIPMIVIATDTRPSSSTLYEEAVKGIKLLGTNVEIKYFEHHTTPQLHYIVRAINNHQPIDDYIQQFCKALKKSHKFCDNKFKSSPLFLDCANGVGALWIEKYLENNGFVCKKDCDKKEIDNLNEDIILVNLFNTNTNEGELLNNGCGADFVKINTHLPANFPSDLANGTRCASFDGDADRLIYFYPNIEGGKNNISLLDGDHICALFAKFVNEQLNEAKSLGQSISLTFGVVQTAYANGNSTRYFTNKLNIKPLLTKTGTKYLEEAAQKFDIGIYFEANGHGTAYFSDKFHKLIKEFNEEKEKPPRYIQLLALFSQLVNEVDGDAIADLMTVEFLLRYFQWSIQDWEKNTYNNSPSFQIKVPVPNRNFFVTPEDNETQLLEPIGMQQKINECVERFSSARAFIRPSGTEQIVRIYSEADSIENAKQLANELEKLVKEETLKSE